VRVYRVVIREDTCIGSSNCMEEAPDAYAVDERGIAVLVHATAPDEVLLLGARACPVDAIQLFDPTSGRRVHP
jgi:ferredoxin